MKVSSVFPPQNWPSHVPRLVGGQAEAGDSSWQAPTRGPLLTHGAWKLSVGEGWKGPIQMSCDSGGCQSCLEKDGVVVCGILLVPIHPSFHIQGSLGYLSGARIIR